MVDVNTPAESAPPWLTIVTIHKDDPAGLARTRGSVRSQVDTLVEHVVVDGSTAAVSAVDAVLAEGAELVTVLRIAPEGIYQAMGAGLAAATGDYVLFLNAGDELADERVLRDVRDALLQSHPEWAFGRLTYVTSRGSCRPSAAFDYEEERRSRFRRGRVPLQPALFASRASLLDLGGMGDTHGIASDYAMVLRLSQRSTPLELDRVVTRFALDGVSSSRWHQSLREALQARCDIYGLNSAQRLRETVLSLPLWGRAWASRILGRV